MNHIAKAFVDLAAPPKLGYHWVMDATLTGTEQTSNLPAGIFTASGVSVTYIPGSPATISFNVTFHCKTPSGSGPPPVRGYAYTERRRLQNGDRVSRGPGF